MSGGEEGAWFVLPRRGVVTESRFWRRLVGEWSTTACVFVCLFCGCAYRRSIQNSPLFITH